MISALCFCASRFLRAISIVVEIPQADIVASHVAHQGYQDVAVVLHRGPEIGPGGLDVPPGAPENIHFP